jgi:outer membrane protein assembly factor BamB
MSDRRYQPRGHKARVSPHGRQGYGVAIAILAVFVVLGVILAGLAMARSGKTTGKGTPAGSHGRAAVARHVLAAAEAGLLPWHLAAPISREVVTASSGNRLIILGGLSAGGASASSVNAIRTTTGTARYIGALAAPVHDAAVAAIGERALVFGGGSQTSVATVQAFSLRGRSGRTRGVTAGSMPMRRSDAAAVTIGSTTYVVGGYDGAQPDAAVLATTNGRRFTTVATLHIPVRYPAVAALGGRIYVFGGQAIRGPHAGAPVDAIQAIDPARHTASVIGHLPEPVAGALAVTLNNELFVAGGDTTGARLVTAGLGTTQLVPGRLSSRSSTVSTIYAFDPATKQLLRAGSLQVPVSHAGVAVIGSTAWIVGGESGGALLNAVQMFRPNRAFGTAGAPGAGSPFFGARLLIADRGNNRLLYMNDKMHVVWKYPSAKTRTDPLHFYFPDDAFFVDHGTAILSNQEQNDTIVKIGYPSGKILWSYGHPRRPGTARGYLHEPDDAFLLRNGQVSVADAVNCRVLVLNQNGTVAHQIGTNGVCVHHPPTSMGSPNGDTPLANGNLLISEINGSWVSEYTLRGKLVWTTQLPISYPSDPQQLGPDRYLIADYASPGQVIEFNRKGQILYRYHPSSGPGMLNHPSLAEMLPSGVIMVNDDYNDRMVAIDPTTKALVWQYGVIGRAGTGRGRLNTPDGFDLLLPNGTTPTHPTTG